LVEGSPGLWGFPASSREDKEKELMSYDNEIQRLTEIERVVNGRPSRFDMDEAFCGRMRPAIAAGLESAPTGVVTTPGTKNPRYVSDLIARYPQGLD
jgi:hypothetical protein